MSFCSFIEDIHGVFIVELLNYVNKASVHVLVARQAISQNIVYFVFLCLRVTIGCVWLLGLYSVESVVNDDRMNMYFPALRSIAGKCCLYGKKCEHVLLLPGLRDGTHCFRHVSSGKFEYECRMW